MQFLTFLFLAALIFLPAIVFGNESAENPYQYHTVSLETLEKAVKQGLKEQGIGNQLEVSITNKPGGITLESDQEPAISIEDLTADETTGRFSAQVNLLPGKSITVLGRFERMVQIPILTRKIFREEVIEPSDISWLAMEESRLSKDTITDSNKLVGKTPRRTLYPRQPVNYNYIASPVIISRNSVVDVWYETSNIHLTTKGQVLDNANKGQMVRVKNVSSGKIIYGIAEGPNRVRIPSAASSATATLDGAN